MTDIEQNDTETDRLIGDGKSSSHADDSEPIGGFLFLGFVSNIAFSYYLQEMKLFNDMFGGEFGSRSSCFFSVSTFVGQVMMLLVGSRLPQAVRIPVSMVVLSICLVFVPLLVFWGGTFKLYIVLGVVCLMGFTSAVLQSSCSMLTSTCSERVRLFYTLGTCASGLTGWFTIRVAHAILVKCYGISTTRGEDNAPTRGEFVISSTVLASGSIILFIATGYYTFILSKTRAVVNQANNGANSMGEAKRSMDEFLTTVLYSLPLLVAACIVIFTTYIVFPDQLVKWAPSSSFWGNNPTFYQESVLFGYNLFDVCGRLLGIWFVKLSPTLVIAGSVVRSVLIPFFFFAARGWDFFSNDVVKFVLLLLYGVSDGLILTWAFTLAPTQPGVKPENAEITGALSSLLGTIGMVIGTGLASALPGFIDKYLVFRPYDVVCAGSATGMVECIETVQMTPLLGSS